MATLSLIAHQRPITSLTTDGTETVLEAVLRAAMGTWLDAECGGTGTCGRCRCRVVAGAPELTPAETGLLTPEELSGGMRLACQLPTGRDITVELAAPAELRRAKAELAGDVSIEVNPVLRKVVVSLTPPDLHDQRSDWQRLCEALGVQPGGDAATAPPLTVLRDLPTALRTGHFSASAVFHGSDIIGIEPGDTSESLLAAAVDIGTTTIAAYIIDLARGRVLSVTAGANPQSGFGADVISRISAIQDNATALPEMQRLAVGAINDLLTEATTSAGVAMNALYELVAVGNPCMLHLLAGVDPRHLAGSPYIPAFGDLLIVPAAELGLRLNPGARVCLLPGISGYVGADIVADILATDLHRLAGTRLLIDIGTNGEMVLAHNGRLISCATAAGPAFEGAHIACGMRAAAGAIEHVSLDDRLEVAVIRSDYAKGVPDGRDLPPVEPIGLCGSGLLDAMAALVKLRVVDASGRVQAAQQLPDHLASRLFSLNGSIAFRLAGTPARPVYVSQHDVRQVQMAKGAIRTGISILLQELGLTHADLDEVLLAGAFGSYLSPESALIIGMLPPVARQCVRAVGNTAGDGASLAAASAVARAEAVAIGRSCGYVELSVRKDFQSIFLKEIAFPTRASGG